MKYIFMNAAVISGLLLSGTSVFAQEHDIQGVFQKVRVDIDQLPSVRAVLSQEDRYSFAQMNRDLDELQQACDCNQRTQPAFTDLVDSLQRAMTDNRIAGRDHQILQEDLNLLRGTTYSDTQAFAR